MASLIEDNYMTRNVIYFDSNDEMLNESEITELAINS
jgi:hypothetical protein